MSNYQKYLGAYKGRNALKITLPSALLLAYIRSYETGSTLATFYNNIC